MPPQTNATVTAVAGAGTADDWDRAAAAGASKWAGEVRAYYRESRDRVTDGSTVTFVKRRELIVDESFVREASLDEDDVITFKVDTDSSSSTASAASIPRRELADIPDELQTSRIVLEDV